MNRRDFIKIAGMFGMFSIVPEFATKGIEMSTYTELMMKLADGKTLDALEKAQLSQYTQRVDDVSEASKSWQNVDGKIKNQYLNLPLEVITSTTLVENVANFSVDIPSNYQHLVIMGQGRTTQAVYGSAIFVRFNNDNGANYRVNSLWAQSTTPAATQDTAATASIIGVFSGTSATSGSAGNFFAFVPHIGSSFWKGILSLIGNPYYDATNMEIDIYNGIWKNTSRINSIKFIPQSGNILAGSLISVYGIR